jgi:hypothetical protein
VNCPDSYRDPPFTGKVKSRFPHLRDRDFSFGKNVAHPKINPKHLQVQNFSFHDFFVEIYHDPFFNVYSSTPQEYTALPKWTKNLLSSHLTTHKSQKFFI